MRQHRARAGRRGSRLRVGGLPADAALLPYWLGAAFIRVLQPLLDPALAARIPFALLLVAVLVLTWYATFHLARTEAAQPLPFAFGGEANPVDYARAIADGALLALIASPRPAAARPRDDARTGAAGRRGAVPLRHRGQPVPPMRRRALAVLLALPVLAASGAPAIAVALGVVGSVVCARSSYDAGARASRPGSRPATSWPSPVGHGARRLGLAPGQLPLAASALSAAAPARLVHLAGLAARAVDALAMARATAAPAHRRCRSASALVALAACIAMGGSDRALLLGLPAVAVLAAFALPTLRRSLAAAIDWFSVFFFSIAALADLGHLRLAADRRAGQAGRQRRASSRPASSPTSRCSRCRCARRHAGVALARPVAHRAPPACALEKPGVAGKRRGAVLAAADDAVLPLLDYARSYRPLVQRLAKHVPQDACIAAPACRARRSRHSNTSAAIASTAWGRRLRAACRYLLRDEPVKGAPPAPEGWRLVARERRPTDRDGTTAIYRRAQGR